MAPLPGIETHARRALACALSLTLMATAGAAVSAAAAATTIVLRARATVSEPQVRLGEVAEITAADHDLATRLGAIVVGASPLPGKVHEVSRAQVIVALRRSGFDSDALDLAGPKSASVTRSATVVTGQRLVEAGRAALAARAPEDVTPEIICARAPSDIVVPEGNVELRISVPPGPVRGSRTVNIALLVEGRVQRRALVTYDVKLWAEVVVARRFLPRHAALDPAAFSVERRDVALVNGRPLRSIEELAGRRAARAIPANTIIAEATVEQPPVINRGEIVLVSVRAGAVTVTTQAVALADARVGESLRLRQPSARQEFEATAVGPKQARIVLVSTDDEAIQ
jgi:flagella basal body P-ring formation protein FlgA